MIRYKGKFQVHDGQSIEIPKGIKHNESFLLGFNTKRQVILCEITYLGQDEIMLQHKWYQGIIELRIGEKFPPFGKDYDEYINLEEKYNLCERLEAHNFRGGNDIVGECKLEEAFEIIRNSSDVYLNGIRRLDFKRETDSLEEAKKLFYKYNGLVFYLNMDRMNEDYDKYQSYHIKISTEVKWIKERQQQLLTNIQQGKALEENLGALSRIIIEYKDIQYLQPLVNIIENIIDKQDAYIRLIIGECLQRVIVFLLSKKRFGRKKLLIYKNFTISILNNVIENPIEFSEKNRKWVSYMSSISNESIEDHIINRAKESLYEFVKYEQGYLTFY